MALIASAGVIAAVSLNDTASNATSLTLTISDITNKTPKLANVVNGISIDTPYVKRYLEIYKNFSTINYEKVLFNSAAQARLTVGAKEDNIYGFEIGNKRYAVHLILCNYNTKTCAFRVNGVATGALAAANNPNVKAPFKFNLDEDSSLQIESIQFDYCDNRRFCNMHYEAYDIVNLKVITR